MNNHTKKLLYYLPIFIFSIFILNLQTSTVIDATPTPLHAFSSDTVPSGISTSKLLPVYTSTAPTVFTPMKYLNTNGDYVNAFVNGQTNPMLPLNNGFTSSVTNQGGSYITLWANKSQNGALWSHDNYDLDLDKDQYFSFWIWGSDTDLSTATTGGMTFTLQNDPRRQNAFSYDNAGGTITNNNSMKFAPNETAGTFAADQTSPHLGNAVINSWSLDLDLQNNNSGKVNDSFDLGVYQGVPSVGNIFISAGYPSEESTYAKSFSSDGTAYYTMPRSTVDKSNISGAGGVGMWHHLRLLYKAPTDGNNNASMTYWFNDIYEDGSTNTNTGDEAIDTQANPKVLERTFPLDISKFNVTKNSDGKRMVKWGLTFSANTTTSRGYLVVENASPVMNVSIKPEIIDVTQDNRVLTSNDNYVNSGDSLIFKNTLSYNSGITDWTNIKANVGIPTGVSINSANYGSMTYGTGSNISQVNISKASFATNTDGKNYLTHTLSKGLSANESSTTSSNAVMNINATANAANNTEIKVPGIDSFFNGDYYVGRSMSQSFIIRGKQTRDLQLSSTSSSPIKAFIGGSVSLNGTLKYGNGSTFVDPGASIYLSVNGSDKNALNAPIKNTGDTSIDISDVISKELSDELKAGQLNAGDNKITIYARDSLGNKSNTLSFTIDVSDQSAVLVLNPEGYSFADIQALYSGLVHRKGDWKVNVDAVNSAWSLSANASNLTYDDSNNVTHKFDGELVYKKDSNIESMSEPVPIASSTSTTGSSTTIIGQNWLTDEGVLLKSNGETNQSGKYSGTINWNLVQGI